MPWTPKQHRLVEWVKSNPKAARSQGYKISKATATKMASEGIINRAPAKKPGKKR